MTPAGQRGFATPDAAKQAAKAAPGVTSFAIISHPRQQEFAWVAPVEFFMSRSVVAISAGIKVVEMGP